VERELAACVNILPAVSSVYQWQGQVETSSEALLLIKTAANRYPDLEQAIRALHPYELPEIVTVPVQDGLQPYLDWVEQCTYKSV
jgi:periplasmic divalent cation tolerance protein